MFIQVYGDDSEKKGAARRLVATTLAPPAPKQAAGNNMTGGSYSPNGSNSSINYTNNDPDSSIKAALPPNSREHDGAREIMGLLSYAYMTRAGQLRYFKTPNITTHCFAQHRYDWILHVPYPMFRRLGWNGEGTTG